MGDVMNELFEDALMIMFYEQELRRAELSCGVGALILLDIAASIRDRIRPDLLRISLPPTCMSPWRALLASRNDRGFLKTKSCYVAVSRINETLRPCNW